MCIVYWTYCTPVTKSHRFPYIYGVLINYRLIVLSTYIPRFLQLTNHVIPCDGIGSVKYNSKTPGHITMTLHDHPSVSDHQQPFFFKILLKLKTKTAPNSALLALCERAGVQGSVSILWRHHGIHVSSSCYFAPLSNNLLKVSRIKSVTNGFFRQVDFNHVFLFRYHRSTRKVAFFRACAMLTTQKGDSVYNRVNCKL